jgi:hypothetical protein
MPTTRHKSNSAATSSRPGCHVQPTLDGAEMEAARAWYKIKVPPSCYASTIGSQPGAGPETLQPHMD